MSTFLLCLLTIACLISLNESHKSGSNRGGSSNRNYNGGWSSSSNSNTPSPVTSSSNTNSYYSNTGWNNRGNGDDEDVGSNARSNCWGRNRRNKRNKRGSSWSKGGSGNDGDHGYTYSTTLDEDCDDDDDDTNGVWFASTYEPEETTEEPEETRTTEEYTTSTRDSVVTEPPMDTTTSTTEEDDTSTTEECIPDTLCPCFGEYDPVCCDGNQYDTQCHAECDCYFDCDEGECQFNATTPPIETTRITSSTTPRIAVVDCPDNEADILADETSPCECFTGRLIEGCPPRCELEEPVGSESICVTPENAASIGEQEQTGKFLTDSTTGNTLGAIGGLIAAIVVISCCLMIAVFYWKKRKNKYDNIAVADDIEGEVGGIEIGFSTATSTKTGLDGEESQEIGYETGKTQNIVQVDSSDDDELLIEDEVALPEDEENETRGRVLNALIADGNDNYTQR